MSRVRNFALPLLASLVAASCQQVFSPQKKAAPADAPTSTQCPQSPAEWQQFVEDFAANEQLVATCELDGCDPDFLEAVRVNAKEVLDKCPAAPKCTEHMRTFVPVWMAQHSLDTYGFTVSNKDYDARLDGPTKPKGLMAVPEALAAALPDAGKVAAAAKENGWKYLTHDSAISGVRTFVYIRDPQGRFDQWMLLNLEDENQHEIDARYPLSMISVQKKDAAGRSLPKVILNFRDYEIKKGPLGLSLVKADDANGKCYSCHLSGTRQLIDRRTKVLAAEPVKGETGSADFAYKRLKEFNAILRSYGLPDWDGLIVPETHGPVLGEEQGCAGCHNGRTRGVLTVSTSTAQLRQKIYYELSMPPEAGVDVKSLLEKHDVGPAPLTTQETQSLESLSSAHERLLNDFEASRYPALKAWLLETSCQ